LAHPSTVGVSRVLWLGDPRALPVGGWTVEPGLAYALTDQRLPDATSVFTPAGPGPASLAGNAVRLATNGGTVHLGRLLASDGVRYVVVLEGLSESIITSDPPSVSAPPPPELTRDLADQDDLQAVPGLLGVQVYQNGDFVPVTATRGTALGTAGTWSYPGPADVAGWQAALSALADGSGGQGMVSAGTLYAGYAPAGSFTLTNGGTAAARTPAFGWAAQYATKAGPATLALSAFPLVPLAVLVEVVAWVVLLLALIGRRHRVVAPHRRGS
jgi:hypothetical protein